jgi:hypothetical protein
MVYSFICWNFRAAGQTAGMPYKPSREEMLRHYRDVAPFNFKHFQNSIPLHVTHKKQG